MTVAYTALNKSENGNVQYSRWLVVNGKRILSLALIFASLLYIFRHEIFSQTTATSSAPKSFFGIMIDAGSTGSRVHVYEFAEIDGRYEVLDELFEQVKPGLSSYAENPNGAAASIGGLLDVSKQRIPEDLWKETPVALKATAGLRLLRHNDTEAILQAVEEEIKKYPFKLVEDGISIMSGTNEGIFGWLTINILLNHISSTHVDNVTTGMIDLGGGSQQICFLSNDPTTFVDLDETFNEEIKFFNSNLHLYVHSYLGFGLMSAREAVFNSLTADADSGVILSSCFAPATHMTWSNAGSQYSIASKNSDETTDWYESCRDEVRAVVSSSQIRPLSADDSKNGVFFIFSYFFDKAEQAGIITEDGGVITPESYEVAAATKACHLSAQSSDDQFFCLDLCLLASFLRDGYRFPADKELLSVKKLNGRETSWTLGAMYSMLN